MSVQIVSFHSGLLADAGALLAQRHQRDRALFPELPKRFENPITARAAVEAVWSRTQANGVAAMDSGRLVGYLIGDMVIHNLWGRSAWIRLAGCAIAPDQSVGLVGELYAALASCWVAYGCFTHFVLISVADSSFIHAWFALSFGIEQVHALLTLHTYQPDVSVNLPNLEIRRATPDDRATLSGMYHIIRRHLAQAPVWGVALPEDEEEFRTGYAELVDEPTATVWLAFQQGQATGFQVYFPAEPTDDNLLVPEQCIELNVAGTIVSARGRGIGQALTQHGLAYACSKGYRYCLTDWRSANLLSARFWPRQGFRPVVYRLVRRIDTRIAWANGRFES